MSSGGTGSQSSRHHSGLGSTPARGVNRQHDYSQVGQGYARVRTADRRTKPERDSTNGRMDAGFVEVRYVDPATGEVYVANEGARLFLPFSRDWPAMTLDEIPGGDDDPATGAPIKHKVLLDGLRTLYPNAPSEFSPDVGKSVGTAHLPAEKLPILPGDTFGPDRQSADFDLICPDGFFKEERGAGKWQERIVPIVDPSDAVMRRVILGGDVKELAVKAGASGIGYGNLIEGPGYVSYLPFLHERIPSSARSNCLLKGSTVPSPYGGVLDTDTVYEYKILKDAVVTIQGDNYCSLLPYAVRPSVDTNLYSLEVCDAIICEWINRGSAIEKENIARTHKFVHAVAAYAHDIVCCAMAASDFNAFKACLKAKLNTAAAMAKICAKPCASVGRRSGPGDPPPPEPPPQENPPGLAPSDARLKNDLRLVGERGGVKIYSWDWNAEARRIGADRFPPVGALAQEVQATHPDAVSTDEHGYLCIDYSRIW